MPVFPYNETSDTSNNLLETGELVFGNTPWFLTGSNSNPPQSFVLQIQGGRSSATDRDFYIIRGDDLKLPTGTTIDDYAIYLSYYSNFGGGSVNLYSGARPFGDTSPFATATSIVGQAVAGSNYLSYALGNARNYIAIEATRDNTTFNRPTPYLIELAFVYKPQAQLKPRFSVFGTSVTRQAEGNSGPTNYTFSILRSGQTSGTASVSWSVLGTSANPATPSDFVTGTPISGTLTFLANETQKIITIPVAGDTTAEQDEEFSLQLSGASFGAEIIRSSQSAIIVNDDGAIPKTLSIRTSQAGSEAGPIPTIFLLSRTGDISAALSVAWALSGSAISSGDFDSLSSGTALFAAGASETSIVIPSIDDAVVDPGKTLTATITLPTGFTLTQGGSLSATATLIDNEAAKTLSITANRDGSEAGPVSSVFTISRTGDLALPLTVTYALSGTATRNIDYSTTPTGTGSVTIAANSSNASFAIPTIDDTQVDPGETLIATLTLPTGYTVNPVGFLSATATLGDNDLKTLSISATRAGDESPPAGQSKPLSSLFTLSRNDSLARPLTVDWELSGSAVLNLDYSGPKSGSITFATGSAVATLEIPTLDDNLVDPGKILTATLTKLPPGYVVRPNGGSLSASATLIDNENTLQIVATTNGNESGPVASRFTATRSGNLASELKLSYSLSGSAEKGKDYTDPSNGILTFAAGSSTASLDFPTIDDTLVDPGEALTVALTPPPGYGAAQGGFLSATATLIDNDQVVNTVSIVATSNGMENGSAGPTPLPTSSLFTATRTGNLTSELRVPWALSSNRAEADIDYSGAVSGILLFAAGSSTATLAIPTLDDDYEDPDVDITITLRPPAGTGVTPGKSLWATALQVDDESDDDTPPAVSAITFGPNDGRLSSGEELPVILTFTETVLLTGNPWLVLNNGGIASFNSGSNSNQLRFLYRPAPGQSATDLATALSNALNSGNGAIRDLAGNPAVSTSFNNLRPLGPPVAVDTTAPTVSAITFGPNDGNLSPGEAITLLISVSKPVVVTGTPTLQLNNGGSAAFNRVSETNQLVFTYIPAAGQATPALATATRNALALGPNGAIRDQAGNAVVPTGFDNVKPPGPPVAVSAPVPVGGTLAVVPTTNGSESGPTGPIPTRFTATRTGNLSSELRVGYDLTGSATRGSDYTDPNNGTLIFAPGSNTATLAIPTLNDTSYDPGKTLTITLRPPSGYTRASNGALSATATQSDDEPHQLVIAQTRDGNEAGAVGAVFTLSKTGPRTAPLTVTYTLSGSATARNDYTGSFNTVNGNITGTVTFQPGSNTTTLTLPVVDDSLVEGTEEIIARITAPAGYVVVPGFDVADALILDNDPVTGTGKPSRSPVSTGAGSVAGTALAPTWNPSIPSPLATPGVEPVFWPNSAAMLLSPSMGPLSTAAPVTSWR